MIIDWLTETLRTVLSAQLPYLWMILLSLGLFCMLFAVMFVNIKNGAVGWLAFVMTAGVMIFGLCSLPYKNHELPEDGELDGKAVMVRRITQKGLKLETGDTVMPAGIELLARRDKQYREMVEELETVINNKPVTLDRLRVPEGYLICAYDGTDLAEHLLRKGLARAGAGASDMQRRLQFEAQESRVGIWKQAWQGRTSSPFMTALRAYGIGCLASALFWGFLFWRLGAVSAWREDRELTRLCEKLDLMEENHGKESNAGSGNS